MDKNTQSIKQRYCDLLHLHLQPAFSSPNPKVFLLGKSVLYIRPALHLRTSRRDLELACFWYYLSPAGGLRQKGPASLNKDVGCGTSRRWEEEGLRLEKVVLKNSVDKGIYEGRRLSEGRITN